MWQDEVNLQDQYTYLLLYQHKMSLLGRLCSSRGWKYNTLLSSIFQKKSSVKLLTFWMNVKEAGKIQILQII